MTATDNLAGLARGVAERLGAMCTADAIIRTDEGHAIVRHLSWLYSPEGAFWLLGQIDQRGLEVQVPFERALYQRVSWVWKLTPEAILRAAAQALGVRDG